MSKKFILPLILFLALFSNHSFSQRVNGELLVKMAVQSVKIDGESYLGLFYQNAKDWHTYWKNPGDAGTAFINSFKLDGEDITNSLVPLEWPSPKRFYLSDGDVVGYGYGDTYGLFYKLPKNLKGKLTIDSKWLVCRERCIPGDKTISGNLGNGLFYSDLGAEFMPSQELVKESFKNIPKEIVTPENFTYSLNLEDDQKLHLFYCLKNTNAKDIDLKHNFLYPFPHPYFNFGHEELYYSPDDVCGVFHLDFEGQYLDTPVEFPTNGIFTPSIKLKFVLTHPETQKKSIFSIDIDKFQVEGIEKQKEYISTLLPIDWKNPTENPIAKKMENETKELGVNFPSDNPTKETSLIVFFLLAFLGGFILNFMPCVLPVISLKLFGLIKHQHASQKVILKHNLFYTLGILFTFSLLALVVMIVKLSGEEVGWGFHLQSPSFVAIMIVIVFILTLNLFGLFEFATPGGKSLANVETKGVGGDFFNGILAVILSTPCSAPFLGTALTFAFTSPWYIVWLIFLSIGLGLALPFLLTGIFPKALNIFPRPGMWMDHLKKFLGLTLLLTTIWLVDVYNEILNSKILLLKINLSLAMIFFAIYFHKNIGKKIYFKILFFLIALLVFGSTLKDIRLFTPTVSANAVEEVKSELNWIPWSTEKMEKFQNEGKIVFMDFTANWCFTCKVNEKLVLETSDFKKLADEKNLTLLKGDWTKKDEKITLFLKSQGIVGVPAYFIQKPNGELINLGELINIQKIKDNLEGL